jgi:hypothetical protein
MRHWVFANKGTLVALMETIYLLILRCEGVARASKDAPPVIQRSFTPP